MNDAHTTGAARPWVLGLTGGIGSGKSVVAARLAELGAAIVDTDQIAHALTAPGGAAIAPLRAVFGDAAVTAEGALDRAAMRARVFADAGARAQLEAIVHPLIRAESGRQVQQARGAPYVVLVVPLLVESGNWRARCDRVAVVDCPEEIQLARVMTRNGLDEAQVSAIMAAQATRAVRNAAADELIDNNAGFAELMAQTDALHRRCLAFATARTGSSSVL